MPTPPLILVNGPTAAGKSSLALALARRVRGVVVNADAMKVYRDLAVLTNRPFSLPASASCAPHVLYGYRDGNCPCSAARWAEDAASALKRIWNEGRVPILAGGSGLYVRALLEGLAPVPPIPPGLRTRIRAALAEAGAPALHARLARLDPLMAARLDPHDGQRLARAFEVRRATGKSLLAFTHGGHGGHEGNGARRFAHLPQSARLCVISIQPKDREELDEAIFRRTEALLAGGAVCEVKALLARKLDPTLPVMKAHGVREIKAWLDGALTREGMRDAICAATRRYARRQLTWLRHQQPRPHIILCRRQPGGVPAAVERLVRGVLLTALPCGIVL